MPYRIKLAEVAEEHLKRLQASQRFLVAARMQVQLAHQPTMATRNRKRMKPNDYAEWELRVRDLRVYYDVEEEPEPVVHVKGIGVKVRDRVFLGGVEEVDFS